MTVVSHRLHLVSQHLITSSAEKFGVGFQFSSSIKLVILFPVSHMIKRNYVEKFDRIFLGFWKISKEKLPHFNPEAGVYLLAQPLLRFSYRSVSSLKLTLKGFLECSQVAPTFSPIPPLPGASSGKRGDCPLAEGPWLSTHKPVAMVLAHSKPSIIIYVPYSLDMFFNKEISTWKLSEDTAPSLGYLYTILL